MELNQELTGSEFIRVHGVEQYPFLCFNSYIFSVKFRRHWAPDLQLEKTHTHKQSSTLLFTYLIPVGIENILLRYW